MKRVVGLGACVLDTLISCDKFPKEDSKQKAESIFVTGGGPVGNALVVMAKLGVNAEVVGGFGSDNSASFLLEDFEKYNVSTKNAKRIEGATSFVSYVLLSQESKSRTCVFDRGSVLDVEENVNLSAIDGADVLHLDGNYINGAIYAAKYAKKKGVKVSLDAGGLYAGVENLLPLVDILIPSAEFATGLTKKENILDAMAELSARYNPEILVVTDGSNGGYYWENGEAKHYPTCKIKAVDTNGAGDTFHGAFVAGYCQGKALKECCAFASDVAAYKCTQVGVRSMVLSAENLATLRK